MKTEISVIVPAYRVESYLPQCIESILNQTFADFELILVDDGSPDRCPEICDEAAARDARVRVIHQANQGLSAARNAGMEMARGTWLSFVDSDDFVSPDFLEKLHDAAVREKAECAMCGVQLTDEDGKPMESSFSEGVLGGQKTITGQRVLETLGRGLYTIVANKLYRREIWQNLRFPVGRRNEDLFMFADVFCAVRTLACVAEPMYFYRQRRGSITHSTVTLRNLDEMWAFAACFDALEAHGQTELMAEAEKRMFAKLTGVYYQVTKEERRSDDMKRAKRAQWHIAMRLMKRGQFSMRSLLRTLLFQALPGIYVLRMKG